MIIKKPITLNYFDRFQSVELALPQIELQQLRPHHEKQKNKLSKIQQVLWLFPLLTVWRFLFNYIKKLLCNKIIAVIAVFTNVAIVVTVDVIVFAG